MLVEAKAALYTANLMPDTSHELLGWVGVNSFALINSLGTHGPNLFQLGLR
jgi:hypothetical protein